MAARFDLQRHIAPRSGKRVFAKPARLFASAAARLSALPGFPLMWVMGAATALVLTVSGAFETGAMALPVRIGFWAVLMGWNTLKWQLWFAVLVRRNGDWWRAAGIGAVALNLPLPLEIMLALRLFGIAGGPRVAGVWVDALAISAAIFVALLLFTRRIYRRPATAPGFAATGLAARARFDPAALIAIVAEDHYCRLRFADGSSHLVHYRFGDAVADAARLDGAQVHRGAWVAAPAIRGAARDGRRWLLLLADGSRVPVSARHLADARARGWLAPAAAPVSRGNSPRPASPSGNPASPPDI